MKRCQIPLDYTSEKWHIGSYRYNTFWYLLLKSSVYWCDWTNWELGLSSENIYTILIFNLQFIIYSTSLIMSNSVSSLLTDLEIPNKICCITQYRFA